MQMNGSFRFLVGASALLLWVGAVATVGEQSAAESDEPPAVEAAPPSDTQDAAGEAGGEEAPSEEADQASEE